MAIDYDYKEPEDYGKKEKEGLVIVNKLLKEILPIEEVR